jgi:antitoxin VapB
MAFHVRDAETDRVVRELARRKGTTLTETIREAAAKELEAIVAAEAARPRQSVREAIAEIQERVAKYPRTGLKADKAFYDWLSGDE